MSKKRLFGAPSSWPCSRRRRCSPCGLRARSLQAAGRHGQARVHHEVPGRLLLHARQRARRSGTRRRRARRSSTPAARAAPTTRARSPRSRTWSPRASRASPSRRRARRCPPRSTRRSRPGVKVVLIDNDIPTWKRKSSVVATNNYNGGKLAGKYLATKLKAGDTLGVLEGVPGEPGARRPRDRHARRARRAEEQDQGRRRSSRPTATRPRARRPRRRS